MAKKANIRRYKQGELRTGSDRRYPQGGAHHTGSIKRQCFYGHGNSDSMAHESHKGGGFGPGFDGGDEYEGPSESAGGVPDEEHGDD